MEKQIAMVFGVGAERGLGAALCRRAAKDGCHVIVGGRTKAKIDAVVGSIVASGGKANATVVDVTQEDHIVAAFEAADGIGGELRFVGYNAGNAFRHDTLSMTAEFFEEAWRVCCLGGFLVGREAGKRMSEQGNGSIGLHGRHGLYQGAGTFHSVCVGKGRVAGGSIGTGARAWAEGRSRCPCDHRRHH